MLFAFIIVNRETLIARTREKVAKRLAPRPTQNELATGVPLFLDQLVDTLRRPPSVPPGTIERSASEHGAALLGRGYTVAQVVHDYGDICQAVTELAEELAVPISTEEFHTLNLCLDNAIAEAVTAYVRVRERGETERSGIFAHELRNKVNAAQLAFQTIESGRAPIGGGVASIVRRSLRGMTSLIDRALLEVRVDSGNTQRQRVHLHELLEDAELDGSMEAGVRGISLSVTPLLDRVDVEVDPQILSGAVSNLLQNAIKFTHEGGHVRLRTLVVGSRVQIDVEDQCGGLPPGKAEELFDAFQQRGKDRTGLGLGLFNSRKGVEASGGVLRVHDRPRSGCVFTIDLPLMPLASSGVSRRGDDHATR